MPDSIALDSLLGNFVADPVSPHPAAVQKALLVARRLQERARALQTPSERRQQAELDRMLQTPSDKATLALMTDQAFRTSDPARAVEHLTHILDVQGVPRFFGPIDRTLMKGFQSFGGFVPGVALPLVKEQMHKETANVILPGEMEVLTRHLGERRTEGVRMNVNFLGEAILSEPEAERRLQQYLQGLQWTEVEVVSIKISTIYSQISPLAREHTVTVLCDRLERLFRTADRARFTRPDGTVVLEVRLPGHGGVPRQGAHGGSVHAHAGPARPAARPGGHRAAELHPRLVSHAARAAGLGAPACRGGRRSHHHPPGERREHGDASAPRSSMRGWPQAPYQTKLETDANYKRMLHEVLKPENLAAMDVGVASHNLFDLAYGLVLAHERAALDKVQFEMLEGMANHQRRALFELSRNLLLYAPACRKENFINAIGYLIRRLDENTGPENFLRHAFKIEVDSPEWQQARAGLPRCVRCDRAHQRCAAPRPGPQPATGRCHRPSCAAGSTSRTSRTPTSRCRRTARGPRRSSPGGCRRCGDAAVQMPLVIAGEEVFEGRAVRDCLDPSRPDVVVGRYRQATDADVARAAECAAEDADGWRTMPVAERFAVLGKVAQELRVARGDLMGAALADGGKTLTESDPEVSEAIDFVEFYRDTARWWQQMPTLRARPKGVVVVVPPWNFPIAIPCGGVAAALAAGNTVILKPASDTVLVAWELCQCFWRAGVSKKALQFVPCSGGKEGRKLVNHPKVNAVILTGGTETALTMLSDNPRLRPVRRDRRQERHDRHRHLGPRPGHQARPALGLQPLRPEVLGHVAAAAARPRCTTTRRSVARCAKPWRASRSVPRGNSTPRWAR